MEYVSLEVAKLANAKGFNEKCTGYYLLDCLPCHKNVVFFSKCNYNNYDWSCCKSDCLTNNVSAPTKFALDKWLLYNHHLQITIFSQSQESWQFKITKPHESLNDVVLYEDYNDKYEAWDEALKVALNMI